MDTVADARLPDDEEAVVTIDETTPLLFGEGRETSRPKVCDRIWCSILVLAFVLAVVLPFCIYIGANYTLRRVQVPSGSSGTLQELRIISIDNGGMLTTANVLADLGVTLPSEITIKDSVFELSRQLHDSKLSDTLMALASLSEFSLQKGSGPLPLVLHSRVTDVDPDSAADFLQQLLTLKSESPTEHWRIVGTPTIHWKFVDAPVSVNQMVEFEPARLFQSDQDFNVSLNKVDVTPSIPNYSVSVNVDFYNPYPIVVEPLNFTLAFNVSYEAETIASVTLPWPLTIQRQLNRGIQLDITVFPEFDVIGHLVNQFAAGVAVKLQIYGIRLVEGPMIPWLEDILYSQNFTVVLSKKSPEPEFLLPPTFFLSPKGSTSKSASFFLKEVFTKFFRRESTLSSTS